MAYYIKLLLLIILSNKCVSQITQKNVIANFIKLQTFPTNVNLLLCWKKDDIYKFAKDLNKMGFPVCMNKVESKELQVFNLAQFQMYIIDMDCPNSEYLLQIASQRNLLNFPFRWLILNPNITKLSNFYLPLNSRIYVMDSIRDEYVIKSIYKVSQNSDWFYNEIALWNNEFVYYNKIADDKNRLDLMGIDMNISVVNMYEDTLNHLDDMKERHVDAITKYNYLLITHITEYLNITEHYKFHKLWGTRNQTTSLYNGEIGDLQLGLSEIGGTPAFITADRISFMEYVGGTTPTKAKFIFKAPPLSAVTNVFILPFNKNVWIACLFILILIFFVVYIIIRWEWSDIDFRKIVQEETNLLRPTVLDVVQMEVGAVCQQGSEAEPKSISGRIAFFYIFLTLTFLYTSYSANIVTLLQSTTDSMQSLESLLESKVKLGVEETPYSKYYIAIQTGDVQKAIYNQKIINKPDSFMSLQKGVNKIRNEFFAFHAETDSVYKVIANTFLESEKCGLVEIEFWFIAFPFVPIRKNSPYRELIKTGFRKMGERGIQSRNFRRIYITKPKCQNQGANFVSVSTEDCYFALVSYSVGLGIAVFIFVIELVFKKFERKNDEVVVFDLELDTFDFVN